MKYLVLVLFLIGCSDAEAPIIIQTCGNGVCESSETSVSCPADCNTATACGDGVCGPDEPTTCPQDCVSECGDGSCNSTEDATSCPADCQGLDSCGNGVCDPDESPVTCVLDCGTCNNRCEGNDAHFCGEDGTDEFVSCPEGLSSSCLSFDEGVACDCGSLPEGGASCLDASNTFADVVECNGGGLEFFLCPVGTVCDDSQGINCFCDNVADGICPGFCDNDIDCDTCTPQCGVKVCGDNGCEGECGTCPQGKTCQEPEGTCVTICVPDCAGGKNCGSDGCGGTCGICSGDQTCSQDGICTSPPAAIDTASWTATLADGTTRTVSFDENTPNTFFACSVDTSTNFLSLEFSDGVDLTRIYVESDPIGFCLFGRSDFNTFTYQHFVNGSLDQSYGIDSLGATMSLTLACSADAQRIDGTFSSGRLFLNKSASAFPGTFVTISDGVFDCAL